jgi:hypothetical protein
MMTRRLHVGSLLLILLTAASCVQEPTETYGFVATLGVDTTSVERITRTGNRVVSDAVGRSPTVVRRHWEATLAPDGSIVGWTMDTHIPNAPADAQDLHHEAHFQDGAVRLVRHAPGDTTDVTHAATFAVTVPWNAFVYGTYDVLFEAARDLPDTARIGQYFFEGWAEGSVGYARLRRLGNNRVAISSTGLAGSGIAQLDAAGRLQSYSGEPTTYKQEVRRIADVPDIDALAERFAAEERERGVSRALSVRDTVRASVGAATLSIEYSRPLARGRTLMGGLIPYGRVWRTGANAATHLRVSGPILLGGIALDSGSYTLWTLPAEDGVQLIVNAQTDQWGTGYGAQHDIARVPMRVDTMPAHIEQFTIGVEPDDRAVALAAGRLMMEWGNVRWSVPVVPDRSAARTHRAVRPRGGTTGQSPDL